MPRKNPSPTSSFTQERKSIVFTPSSASKATSFSCATTRESRFTIAAMNPAPTISNAGASGSAASGPSKSKAPTASAPASPNNAPCSSIAASTIALGTLAGVLDVSAVATEGPDRPQQLALAATIASARAVEERLFREHFRHAWIVAALPPDDTAPSLLLAVDEDQRLVGADRVARGAFALDDKTLAAGIPLSSLFDYSLSLFRRRGGQDIPVLLARPGRNDHWRALITPPLAKSNLSRNWPEAVVHAQPRLSMLSFMPMPEAPDLNRGGLSPALKNRVCEFIELHIGEKISLDSLSAMAGLSPHHFARAFQQSVGVPPHRYLLRRRLEHVGQMLRDTQLQISHIALAVGFSDQSHLNRHFRRLTGMSPSLARGLER